MQSTGERMPRESPELTTSQSKTSWDHQPHFVIYSLCLATGLEVTPEAREKGLHDIPGNALSTSSSPCSTCQQEQFQPCPGILGKAALAWLPSCCPLHPAVAQQQPEQRQDPLRLLPPGLAAAPQGQLSQAVNQAQGVGTPQEPSLESRV